MDIQQKLHLISILADLMKSTPRGSEYNTYQSILYAILKEIAPFPELKGTTTEGRFVEVR
jgi:hypothetical protein